MTEPLEPEMKPNVAPATGDTENIELSDAELKDVSGGAFDAYLNFTPAPHH